MVFRELILRKLKAATLTLERRLLLIRTRNRFQQSMLTNRPLRSIFSLTARHSPVEKENTSLHDRFVNVWSVSLKLMLAYVSNSIQGTRSRSPAAANYILLSCWKICGAKGTRCKYQSRRSFSRKIRKGKRWNHMKK